MRHVCVMYADNPAVPRELFEDLNQNDSTKGLFTH